MVEGVATHVRGRQLVVGVAVEGLAKGEKPVAVVTPRREGGVAQSWQVPLVPGAEGRFSACLPDESRGLDQSIDLGSRDLRCIRCDDEHGSGRSLDALTGKLDCLVETQATIA